MHGRFKLQVVQDYLGIEISQEELKKSITSLEIIISTIGGVNLGFQNQMKTKKKCIEPWQMRTPEI